MSGTALQQMTSAAAQPRLTQGTEPPRLHGDSSSAHLFASATTRLPLPLPAQPLRHWRLGLPRSPVGDKFLCGGPRRLAQPSAELRPRRRLQQHSRPSPVCTVGRHWDPPDSPELDAARTSPRYQTPVTQGSAVGPAPGLHPVRSGDTDTLIWSP